MADVKREKSDVEKVEQTLQQFIRLGYSNYCVGIHNDGEYLVATDGHILAEVSLDEFPELQAIGEEITGYPNWKAVIPNRETEFIEISDLQTPKDLIAEPEYVDCPQCHGGDTENCQECSGEGELLAYLPLQLICINHHWYYQAENINKLVRLIEALQSEPVELSQGEPVQNRNASALKIEAPGVRLIAMPVDHSADADHDIINKVVTRNPKPASQ